MLNDIFGAEKADKIRAFLKKTTDNPIVKGIRFTVENYGKAFSKSDEGWRFLLVVTPICNFFIFAGLFSFLTVSALDFIIFIYIKKIISK